MKDKLVKTGNDYILYSKDKTVLGITSGTMEGRMLSLKNSQTIENGYDLDEVVEDIVKTIVPNDRGEDIWYGTSMAVGKLCFKTALEILGDKKFSEEDIRNAMERVWYWHEDNQDKDCPTLYELIPKHIQSQQQTEWDVEIEMVSIPADRAPNGWDISPKLDEDGCLILRRI
jgi:hypothetical protein